MAKAGLAQEVKTRPIIFGVESVRAILAGVKTQTRRVMKPQAEIVHRPDKRDFYFWKGRLFEVAKAGRTPKIGTGVIDCDAGRPDCTECYNFILDECPHGKPGDRLWVREKLHIAPVAWARKDPSGVCYAADGECPVTPQWRSPMLMPRWASRITLELTEVRVERVQDITDEDARAEGVTEGDIVWAGGSPRLAYKDAWNTLNKARGFGWDTNPWVFVLAFKRVTD